MKDSLIAAANAIMTMSARANRSKLDYYESDLDNLEAAVETLNRLRGALGPLGSDIMPHIKSARAAIVRQRQEIIDTQNAIINKVAPDLDLRSMFHDRDILNMLEMIASEIDRHCRDLGETFSCKLNGEHVAEIKPYDVLVIGEEMHISNDSVALEDIVAVRGPDNAAILTRNGTLITFTPYDA